MPFNVQWLSISYSLLATRQLCSIIPMVTILEELVYFECVLHYPGNSTTIVHILCEVDINSLISSSA